MRFLCTLASLLSLILALPAAELDQAQRKALLDHLNRSSSEFESSIKGLSSEQWNYKPAPEVWSVAECAEHIALSEDLLRDLVEKKVLTGANVSGRDPDQKALDEKVLQMITNRSFKAKAPEPLQPSHRFATPESVLQAFQASRKKTIALASSRGDLREHTAPHPVLKDLDGYQWLLYLSGHTMRHTAQIQEVKANSGFPATK